MVCKVEAHLVLILLLAAALILLLLLIVSVVDNIPELGIKACRLW
jgi:hypothetical protein